MVARVRLEFVLITLIVGVLALYARAEYIPAIPDRHVELAEARLDLDVGPVNRWFSAWAIGDGQAFAVIATDPTGVKLSNEVQEPAYRFMRAGFGWAAAIGSMGRDAWVPYGMALVGAVSLIGILVLAIVQRDRLGARVWVLILNPAIYLGFAGDTAEALAVLLVAVALSTGWRWAAVALGVTRPSYLTVLFGRWKQLKWGIAATVTLMAYAFVRFGADQFMPGQSRLSYPFGGYIDSARVSSWLVAALGTVTLAIGVRTKDWGWAFSGLLVLCLGPDVTADPVNAWRAAGMIPVLWAFGPCYRPPSVAAVESSAVPAPAET